MNGHERACVRKGARALERTMAVRAMHILMQHLRRCPWADPHETAADQRGRAVTLYL